MDFSRTEEEPARLHGSRKDEPGQRLVTIAAGRWSLDGVDGGIKGTLPERTVATRQNE